MNDAIPRSARANLRRVLVEQCAVAGGQAQWARAHGFSKSYVSELLSGRRDISDAVAIALGFLLVETVIPVRENLRATSHASAVHTLHGSHSSQTRGALFEGESPPLSHHKPNRSGHLTYEAQICRPKLTGVQVGELEAAH